MNITFSDNKNIDEIKLVSLFESVKWKSAQFPNELQLAIANSHTVYSAWDDDKLVGLINALSDGVMTVYYHYLLVHPDYQHHNIGFELIRHMKEHYAGFQTQILIAYADAVPFYEKCGFTAGAGETPLYISDLV